MTGPEELGPLAVEVLDPEGRILTGSILGTTDAARIFRRLENFCVSGGLPAVERVFFYEISVGAAFGLDLEDGSRVVLKAHPSKRNVRFLETVCRVQEHLFRRGFPCPRPVIGPSPFGEGYAMVEAFDDRGERADAHRPEVRRAMAGALVWLIRLASEVSSVEDLRLDWTWPEDKLWPTPHTTRSSISRGPRKGLNG